MSLPFIFLLSESEDSDEVEGFILFNFFLILSMFLPFFFVFSKTKIEKSCVRIQNSATSNKFSHIPDFFTGLVILMSFFFAPLVTTFLIKVYSSSSLNLSSAMFFCKEYVRNHYDRIYFPIFDEIITPILILKM